jgi:hypothetical protein
MVTSPNGQRLKQKYTSIIIAVVQPTASQQYALSANILFMIDFLVRLFSSIKQALRNAV